MSNALVVRPRGPLAVQRARLTQRLAVHRARLEAAKDRVRNVMSFSLAERIAEQPWSYIAGGLLLGYAIARLTTRSRRPR